MIEAHLYVPGQVTEIDSTNLEHSVQQFKRAPAQPRRFLIHSSLSRKTPIKKCTALCKGRISPESFCRGKKYSHRQRGGIHREEHRAAPPCSKCQLRWSREVGYQSFKNIVASDVSPNACVLFITCQGNFCLKPALAQHKLGCKRSS